MNEHEIPPLTSDEGGLRAPPHLHGWRKAWWWFDFIILVKLARLRFVAILIVIGVVITQWDTLVAKYEKWTRTAALGETGGDGDTEYFCPMHPAVVRHNPKEKCPICNMPLAKRKKGEQNSTPLPPGAVNRVQLSPYRIVLAGVNTWPAEFETLTKEITAVGYVEFNERGQRTVSARTAGRIDKLIASETGQMVQAGDDLALLFSPDFTLSAQTLLDAARRGDKADVEVGRNRLHTLGLGDDQIEAILAGKRADSQFVVRSPISGHVITKYVKEGQYVQQGTPLYDLADLSTVWIQAQIYEDDLAFLPLGHEHVSGQIDVPDVNVTATTRSAPDEVFQGKLAFVYPHADQQTRTVTVRFEVANPGHRLRPGSTATVTLRTRPQEVKTFVGASSDSRRTAMLEQGRVLAVPETAVIDTGRQKLVYRQSSPGVFDGVEVVLGPRMAGPGGAIYYPVLRGIEQGDRIVTSGSFLVDAETRLNSATASTYFGGSSGSQGASTGGTTVRPSTPDDPDAKIKANLAELSPADRTLAESQRFCAVLNNSRLGSMGVPLKMVLEGETVFLCCSGCKDNALASPHEALLKAKQLTTDNGGRKAMP